MTTENPVKKPVWTRSKVQSLYRHQNGRYYARPFAGGKEKWTATGKMVDQDHRDLAQDLFLPRKKTLFGRGRHPVDVPVVESAQLLAVHVGFEVGMCRPALALDDQSAGIDVCGLASSRCSSLPKGSSPSSPTG